LRLSGRLILLLSGLLLAAPVLGGPSGKDIHAEMLATIGPYDDPALTAYLEGLVRDIVSVSEMAGEEFTFTLLDSPEINAFATADNYVYINRGLLNYIANEAQLVSVLAHEVGHITQKHVSLMPVAAGGASFLAWLAGALSGSQEVYQAGQAYANSLLKGHGRDNELDADEAAARYMVALGYDPDQMLEMLGIMKDLEIMEKERAAQRGAPRRSYHGLFASHPRNDTRLRSAVSRAKTEGYTATRDSGAAVYRELTEGLVWGVNFKEKDQKPERYSDMSLRVRFDFPDGWTHAEDRQTRIVTGQPEDGAARLSMQPHPRTPQTAEEYLYNYLDIDQLRDGRLLQAECLPVRRRSRRSEKLRRIRRAVPRIHRYLPAHLQPRDRRPETENHPLREGDRGHDLCGAGRVPQAGRVRNPGSAPDQRLLPDRGTQARRMDQDFQTVSERSSPCPERSKD
jgi:predicted Zn-dependent protease